MRHLFVSISGHGYGHMVQTANLLNALLERMPDLHLTVQCPLDIEIIASRLHSDFVHIKQSSDLGMLMADPMTTEVDASLRAYAQFHDDWEQHLSVQCELLQTHQPDILLSNIAYLPLAAAAQMQIPSVAMCSLNWLDILQGYAADNATFLRIAPTIEAAYRSAQVFLQPQPSMPMNPSFAVQPIGVLANKGINLRQQIIQQLQLDASNRLVLVSYGGIDFKSALPKLPELANTHYLLQPGYPATGQHMHSISDLAISYTDLIRSVDAVITKPGYATITEAVCNETAVLYVPRGDWPEEPSLLEWLHSYGTATQINPSDMQTGSFGEQLESLLQTQPSTPPPTIGAVQGAEVLMQMLST